MSLSGISNVSVINNGADPAVFRSLSKVEARSKLGLLSEKKIVLFVGYLKPVKGIEFLLEAIGQLRRGDVELWLVGDGESKAFLKSMVDQLGVAGMCHFAGARPHDTIPIWLAAADCLVLPSLSEGLPTIVVEAMFSRTPVVATNVGGTPEIVKDRRTGLLVEPRDSAALAHAIDDILTDGALASELAQQAETEVRGRLTWEANARATVASYEDVLRGGARSAGPATSCASSPAN